MARINEHYRKLQAGYLFPEIGRRVAAYASANPGAAIIRMGIGDVTLPLAPAIVEAMREAVTEMGSEATFKGYGPEQGYGFLIDAIVEGDFRGRGVEVTADEIFVSDGSKCDSANIQEIFDLGARMAVTDPVYPVYVDSNVMAGRTAAIDAKGRFPGLVYLPASEANDFLPAPPDEPVDVVYLCSPNNPTGAVADRAYLSRWVDWARATKAVIVFDAAYESYIRDPSLPHSIYEIPGARTCAIEMRSFSKRAGFTGVRCAYTVVPKELVGATPSGETVALNPLWSRRQTTKFNGASYIVQRGAAAVYTSAGRAETDAQIAFYMENAALLRAGLVAAGFTVHGGLNAPYIWLRTRDGLSSWDFFNRLLETCQVVGTPGSGFGPSGEGFFRLSAFNSRANVEESLRRIGRVFRAPRTRLIWAQLCGCRAEDSGMGLPRAIVPGRVYMVTRRCSERRFFLRPDAEMTEAFAYCLAAAARRTGVQVLFSVVMSNHHHTGVADPEGRLPEFLEYLHKFTAKCGNALRGRWESFWSAEQTSCVELVGPEDILDKMTYALTNPVKDHLVDRVAHWPGLDCMRAVARDRPIVARRPRRFFREGTEVPEVETLRFARPPGFEGLVHAEWVALLRERIAGVEQSAAAERARTGVRVIGRKAVLRQRWSEAPGSREPRRNLSPRVAAKNKWARIEALLRNRGFIESYRAARDAFLCGVEVCFPAGTYWLRRFAGVACEPFPAPS